MNYKLFFFACALNLFNYVPNLLASPVIGGENHNSHTHKYHVSVRRSDQARGRANIPVLGRHYCGGTIIHDKYVLSSAHPFVTVVHGDIQHSTNPKSYGIAVLAGTSDTNGEGILSAVDQILIPRQYKKKYRVNGDISVLKLAISLDVAHNSETLRVLKTDQVERDFNFYVRRNAFIVGNGCDAGDNVLNSLLNHVHSNAIMRKSLEVQMTPSAECLPFKYAICARKVDTSRIRTACHGDSGSPLIYDDTVIGVVSWDEEYSSRSNPELILCTRTSIFSKFIQDAMNENGERSEMYVVENF